MQILKFRKRVTSGKDRLYPDAGPFVKLKLKLSHYRPEQALGGSGRLRLRIFMTFATMKVVGRQPYAPAESTPGHMVPSVATGKNPQGHHWGSIPRPSDYQRSALTTTLPQPPLPLLIGVINKS